jgi:hypothetical protein
MMISVDRLPAANVKLSGRETNSRTVAKKVKSPAELVNQNETRFRGI